MNLLEYLGICKIKYYPVLTNQKGKVEAESNQRYDYIVDAGNKGIQMEHLLRQMGDIDLKSEVRKKYVFFKA